MWREVAPSGRNCPCIPISPSHSLRIGAAPAPVVRPLVSFTGPCRRCLARMVWRRCASRPPQHAVHLCASRPARDRPWILAVVRSMLRTIGNGA